MTKSSYSNLELVFGFHDPAFGAYMTEQSLRYVSPSRLLELTAEMSSHHHPLVRYAAGWTATEAGIIPPWHAAKHGEWTLRHRQESVDIGHTIWGAIRDDEWAASTDRHHLLDDLQALNTRRQIAMAYLPVFHLVAHGRAGEPLTAPDTYDRFKKVELGLSPIINSLLTSKLNNHTYGLARELASALLLQRKFLQPPPTTDTPMDEPVIAPASLRHDHHVIKDYRSDLTAYFLREGGKKTAIQVGVFKKDTHSRIFQVIPTRDLAPYTEGQVDILRQIYQYIKGDTSFGANLTEISNNLCDRLKNHGRATKKSQ